MIHILKKEVIDKIRAGEVIEHPASVVKELVENAIDAHANTISIVVKEGGKSYIAVKDDGIGMSAQDCKISIMRHATSKINSSQDLENIKTLGFRGEALASIAAVAKLHIITKIHEGVSGTIIEVENGEIISQNSIGCPPGTKIEVISLFYNTPARKHYLNDIKKELSKCIKVVTEYALIHPEISFEFASENKILLKSHATQNLLNTAVQIYGKDIAKKMIFIEDGKMVRALISKPDLSRGDKNNQHIYINKRPVKSQIIEHAIYDAYHTLLHSHRHPIIVLNVSINPIMLDVNVHPTKQMVKFKDEQVIYNAVFNLIKSNLHTNVMMPEMEMQNILQLSLPITPLISASKNKLESVSQSTLASASSIIKNEKMPEVKIIGIIHECYILAESKTGLIIVDQHAADERFNYEMLMSQYSEKGISTQKLISPENIDLTPSDSIILESNIESLLRFGFQVEPFGGTTYLVRSSPVIMGRQQQKGLLLDLIDEMNDARINAIDTIKERILTRMSCRMSVMKGDKIEHKQAKDIIERLLTCRSPHTCPHGRPTMINISEYELEKKFKRIF